MYSQPSLQTWSSGNAKYGGKFIWPWQIPGAVIELFKPQSKVDAEESAWLEKLKQNAGTPDASQPQAKKFPTIPVVIIGASAAALFLYYRHQHKKGKSFMQAVLPFIDLKKV